MANTRVYFDMSAGGTALGRIVMEVGPLFFFYPFIHLIVKKTCCVVKMRWNKGLNSPVASWSLVLMSRLMSPGAVWAEQKPGNEETRDVQSWRRKSLWRCFAVWRLISYKTSLKWQVLMALNGNQRQRFDKNPTCCCGILLQAESALTVCCYINGLISDQYWLSVLFYYKPATDTGLWLWSVFSCWGLLLRFSSECLENMKREPLNMPFSGFFYYLQARVLSEICIFVSFC